MPKHHSKKKARAGVGRWIEYGFARGLVTLLQYVPMGIAYRFGRAVGWCAWKSLAKRRRVVEENLKVVNAAAGASALSLSSQVREVFMRNGANAFCSFSFTRLSPAEYAQYLECEGIEHLEAALAEQKGVIVLLAHMGPWEVLAYLPKFLGQRGQAAKLGAMYRRMNNLYFDQWFKSVRGQYGTSLFCREDGFHKPVDFLRSGGILGVLADQKIRQGALAPFFGREVPASPLPGLFQRRSGAPVLGVSVVTMAPMKWKIIAFPVVFPDGSNERTRENEALISSQAIEQILSASPLDGFWVRERF